MKKNESIIDLMCNHDDDCGELLDGEGKCPVCGFHPDTQSVGFREVDRTSEEFLLVERPKLLARGQRFVMTLHRVPVPVRVG